MWIGGLVLSLGLLINCFRQHAPMLRVQHSHTACRSLSFLICSRPLVTRDPSCLRHTCLTFVHRQRAQQQVMHLLDRYQLATSCQQCKRSGSIGNTCSNSSNMFFSKGRVEVSHRVSLDMNIRKRSVSSLMHFMQPLHRLAMHMLPVVRLPIGVNQTCLGEGDGARKFRKSLRTSIPAIKHSIRQTLNRFSLHAPCLPMVRNTGQLSWVKAHMHHIMIECMAWKVGRDTRPV